MVGRLLAAAASALAAAEPASACSKIDFSWAQSSTSALLIAVAAHDTVHAGAGDVRYHGAPGHYGPAGSREVYGQVVDVERVGGRAALSLPPDARRAVLVPWDYGADCRPVRWSRSSRWLPVGVRGLVEATLREPRHWVDGLPTFDVHTPGFQPYPHRIHPWRRNVPADSMLSIDDLFTLLDLRPTFAEMDRNAASATLPLVRWAAEHPDLAGLYPASEVLAMSGHVRRAQGLRDVEVPMAGTYRFTVSLDGAPPRTFFARTHARPVKEWDPYWRAGTGEHVPFDGYTLMAVVGTGEATLPYGRDMGREGYLSILIRPEAGADGTRFWRGDIESSLVARAFPEDAALQDFLRADREEGYARYMARMPAAVRARFVESSGGGILVEHSARLEDGRTLVMRGERLSSAVATGLHP